MGLGVETGLRNVIEDTSPQLGGDLDIDGNRFTSIAEDPFVFNDGTAGFRVSGTHHETLNIGGNLGFDPVADITSGQVAAIILTEDTGGTLAAGEYHYDVVFVTDEGVSSSINWLYGTGSVPDITVAANAKVVITGIPISSDPRVIGRTLYRTELPDQVGYIARTIYTINDNSTTTWTDDGSLTPVNPLNYAQDNRTAGTITVGNEVVFSSSEHNLGVGYWALRYNTGYENCVVGPRAGKDITTANATTALGHQAAYVLTTGKGNTLIGKNSGSVLSTGIQNVYVGAYTQPSTGASGTRDNTYVGTNAGRAGPQASTHSYNTGIGGGAGQNTGGLRNVFVGFQAGYQASSTTSNDYNIIIGAMSGQNLDGADRNIIIGYDIDLDDPNGDYQLNIANLIKGSIDGKTIELDAAITLLERGADPAEPAEGKCVLWMSDGTSSQTGVADGDMVVASKVGGVTKVTIIHDHSTAGAWV